MKILNLSTFDHGGAGKAALRLNDNLRLRDVDSRMLVLAKKTENPFVFQYPQSTIHRILNLFIKSIYKIKTDNDYQYNHQVSTLKKEKLCIGELKSFKPDIIIINYISQFFSIDDLHKMHQIFKAPFVRYLMDMAPLTGGCHYAWECDGYKYSCGNCPALKSKYKRDLSYKNLKKAKYLSKTCNVSFIAASETLSMQAKKATITTNQNIEKILLGINPEIFKPVKSNKIKQKYEISDDAKVLFIGSQKMSLKRKGMSYLIEALDILKNSEDFNSEKIVITTAGSNSDYDWIKDNFKSIHLGNIQQEEKLAAAYQSADLFLCPSIEDSGPMMINESIMCGTPVVAFDMGVAPDLVINGKTGYRAALKDSIDFSYGIKSIINLGTEKREELSVNCRNIGIRKCHPSKQANDFFNLFNNLNRSY